jgi:hypothetical protein
MCSMKPSNVSLKVAAEASLVSAVRTLIRSFARVCSLDVNGKLLAVSTLVSAERTMKWSFTSMRSHVSL